MSAEGSGKITHLDRFNAEQEFIYSRRPRIPSFGEFAITAYIGLRASEVISIRREASSPNILTVCVQRYPIRKW